MCIPPMTLTPTARTVLAQRYLRTDEQGHVVETPEDMVLRVARLLASVDQRYDPHLDVEAQTAQYATLMAELRFLPNSPTLMNAGRPHGRHTTQGEGAGKMPHQEYETGHNQAAAVGSVVSSLTRPLGTPPGEPTGDVPVVTPMVYVREVTPWEYRAIVRPLADDSMMTAPELNALGAEGWELIGIVTPSHNTWYYFKRLATQAH